MTGRLGRLAPGGPVLDLFRALPTFPHLDVTDFGAVGDNSTDNQAALAAALAAATTQALPLFVPAGIYRHSGRLTVAGVTLFGITPLASVLAGTTVDAHALDVTGTNPGLHNLGIRGPGKAPRTSNRGGNGVYVNDCTGYTIRNCSIRDVTGAGIMTEDGHQGTVRNNLVQATGADGIYHTEGSTGVEVAYNRTYATGDDAIAVTSYNTALGFCSGFDIHHNSVLGAFESRAITVNGCNGGIVVRGNHVDGGTSGVSVTSVTAWGTLHSTGVDVYGNTLRNINQTRQETGTIGGGALHVYDDLPTGADNTITMHDNQVYNPGLHGILVNGSTPITASFVDNDFWIAAGLTLYQRSNTSTTITHTGSVTALPAAYPGDLVASTVGGLDLAYRYVPA